jgi:hypothetical protein
MDVNERIKHFRDDLPQRDVPELVQKHITYGECYALSRDAYFELTDLNINS